MARADDKRIAWNYYDDHPAGEAAQKLKGYIRNLQQAEPGALNFWYVGLARAPEIRLDQHVRNAEAGVKWSKMHVLYGAADLGSVVHVENELIKYMQGRADRRGEQAQFLNAAGGRLAGDQVYHVYVLIDDHPHSSSGAKALRAIKKPTDRHCYDQASSKISATERDRTVRQRFDRAIIVGDGERPAKYCYVGLTNNPSRRLAEHQGKFRKDYDGDIWEEMRVIYRTKSFQNALDAEAAVIAHARGRGDVTVHNTTGGSYGAQNRAEEFPYYYVYYLEDRR
jgi:predicted GIY-YIG superfamily endonuclease